MELPALPQAHLHFRATHAEDPSRRSASHLIQSHPFNHKVHVLVPLPSRRLSLESAQRVSSFRERVASLLAAQPFLARDEAQPARHLLHEDFLRELRGAQLTVVAPGSSMDGPAPPLAVFDGRLVLRLDHDAYQTLGLQGRKYKRHKETVFYCEVDLQAESFRAGKGLHDRVVWCLSEPRVGTLPLIATCVEAGEPLQLVGWEQRPLLVEERRLVDIHIPDLARLVAGVEGQEGREEEAEELTAELSSFFDWCGMVENGMQSLLSLEEDLQVEHEAGVHNFDTRHRCHKLGGCVLEEAHVADCHVISGTGLVERGTVHRVLQMAQELLEEKGDMLDWIVLSVHGFEDTPLSFASEKGRRFLTSGDNGYAIVIFPGGKLWTFVALDSSEDFSWL